MEIIYPPLVEQCYKAFHKDSEQLTKSDVYISLVENNILTENGLPTQHALDIGWVKEFTEEQDLDFEEFLNVYPVFKQFDEQSFIQIDGFWEISQTLKKELIQKIKQGIFNHDDRIQLESFLGARKEYE